MAEATVVAATPAWAVLWEVGLLASGVAASYMQLHLIGAPVMGRNGYAPRMAQLGDHGSLVVKAGW